MAFLCFLIFYIYFFSKFYKKVDIDFEKTSLTHHEEWESLKELKWGV